MEVDGIPEILTITLTLEPRPTVTAGQEDLRATLFSGCFLCVRQRAAHDVPSQEDHAQVGLTGRQIIFRSETEVLSDVSGGHIISFAWHSSGSGSGSGSGGGSEEAQEDDEEEMEKMHVSCGKEWVTAPWSVHREADS